MSTSRPLRFTLIFVFFLFLFSIIILKFGHGSNPDSLRHSTPTNPLSGTNVDSLTQLQSGGSSPSTDVDDPSKLGEEEYVKWCRDFSGASIYTISPAKLACMGNRISFCLALMLAIFFSLLIELILTKMEHSVRNKVTRELISKVFRELAMLGLISYAVNFLESTGVMEQIFLAFEPSDDHTALHELTQRRVLIFELVHVLLFGLSLFFVLTVVVCYVQVKITWSHWESIEKHDEKEAMQKALAVKRRFRSTNILIRYLNPVAMWRMWKAEDTISYWACRRQFIASNRLPHNFRYFVYLKDRVRRLLVELSEIGYPLWTFVFMVAFGDIARTLLISRQQWWNNAILFVVLFFCVSSVSCTVVLFIVRVTYALYLRQTSKDRHLSVLFDSDFLTESLMQTQKEVVDMPNGTPNSDIMSAYTANSAAQDANQLESNTPQSDTALPTSPEPAAHGEDPHASHSVTNTTSAHYHPSPHTHHLDMKKFFLLRSPRLYLTLMQLVLFVQCFYLAFLTLHYFSHILFTNAISSYTIVKVAFLVFAYISAFYVFLVFPFMVAPFTMLSSQENLSSISSIEKALEHMKKWPKGKRAHIGQSHRSDYHHQPYLDYQTTNTHEELRRLTEKYEKKMQKIKQAAHS